MVSWLEEYKALLGGIGLISVLMALGGIFLLPLAVARIPSDFFLRKKPPPQSLRGRHPALALLSKSLRNLMGFLLVLAGIAMLILPGQGILSIILGLSLMSFPHKRRLILAILRRPRIYNAVDWLRRRAHKPPLILPEES